MEWLDNYAQWAGKHVEERGGGQGLATAAYTAPHALANIVGMRLPGTKASAFEKVLPGGELPGSAAARTRQWQKP
jgi:hypothetical protein